MHFYSQKQSRNKPNQVDERPVLWKHKISEEDMNNDTRECKDIYVHGMWKQ